MKDEPRSGSGGILTPSHSNGTPFAGSVPQISTKSQEETKNSFFLKDSTGKTLTEQQIDDKTWKILDLGLNKVKEFAEKEGIRRETSKLGLTEYEARTLIERYRRENLESGRGSSSHSESGRSRGQIPGVYENERGTEKSEIEESPTRFRQDVSQNDLFVAPRGLSNVSIASFLKTVNKKEAANLLAERVQFPDKPRAKSTSKGILT